MVKLDIPSIRQLEERSRLPAMNKRYHNDGGTETISKGWNRYRHLSSL